MAVTKTSDCICGTTTKVYCATAACTVFSGSGVCACAANFDSDCTCGQDNTICQSPELCYDKTATNGICAVFCVLGTLSDCICGTGSAANSKVYCAST